MIDRFQSLLTDYPSLTDKLTPQHTESHGSDPLYVQSCHSNVDINNHQQTSPNPPNNLQASQQLANDIRICSQHTSDYLSEISTSASSFNCESITDNVFDYAPYHSSFTLADNDDRTTPVRTYSLPCTTSTDSRFNFYINSVLELQ